MMYLFEFSGLIFVFLLGFAEGMITPSTVFRLITMLVVPFAIGIPLSASAGPFAILGLMFFVPPGIVAAGYRSLLGEIFRQRRDRLAQASPGVSHASIFQPSPLLSEKQSAPIDGPRCVACREPLRVENDFCPKCGWTQPA